MQTIISAEEKQELDRLFKDLDYLLDYEMNLGEHNDKDENRELLAEGVRSGKLPTLLSSLANIYVQYKSVARWLR